MLRYRHLLLNTLEPPDQLPPGKKPPTMRDLAKTLGIPIPSMHNYVKYDVLPRLENINKMAEYYGESISSLFSEDDDLTAQLVEAVRNLPPEEKQNLLNRL